MKRDKSDLPRRRPRLAGLLALGAALALADWTARGFAPAPLLAALPALGFALGLRMASRAAPPVSAPAPPPAPVERPSEPVVELRATPVATRAPPEASSAAAREDLEALDIFGDISAREIRSVIAMTDAAAQAISSSVTRADSSMSNLLAIFARSATAEQVDAAVREIEAQIQLCRSMVGEFERDQQAAAEGGQMQRHRLARETSAVMASLEGVDDIALQTTILSMNVSIEAARAGAAGKGFMVIAREIRELASRCKAIAADARGRIATLVRSVDVDLTEDARKREIRQRDSFGVLSQLLDAFSANVEIIVRHEREAFAEAEAAGGEISGAILDTLSRLQFQDIVRQQLEQLESLTDLVTQHLGRVGAAMKQGAEAMTGPSLAEKLDAQIDNYVMDRQRESHQAATGRRQAKNSAPLIEMF